MVMPTVYLSLKYNLFLSDGKLPSRCVDNFHACQNKYLGNLFINKLTKIRSPSLKRDLSIILGWFHK